MTSHKKDELDEGEEEKKEQAGQIQNANTTELEEYDNISEKNNVSETEEAKTTILATTTTTTTTTTTITTTIEREATTDDPYDYDDEDDEDDEDPALAAFKNDTSFNGYDGDYDDGGGKRNCVMCYVIMSYL